MSEIGKIDVFNKNTNERKVWEVDGKTPILEGTVADVANKAYASFEDFGSTTKRFEDECGSGLVMIGYSSDSKSKNILETLKVFNGKEIFVALHKEDLPKLDEKECTSINADDLVEEVSTNKKSSDIKYIGDIAVCKLDYTYNVAKIKDKDKKGNEVEKIKISHTALVGGNKFTSSKVVAILVNLGKKYENGSLLEEVISEAKSLGLKDDHIKAITFAFKNGMDYKYLLSIPKDYPYLFLSLRFLKLNADLLDLIPAELPIEQAKLITSLVEGGLNINAISKIDKNLDLEGMKAEYFAYMKGLDPKEIYKDCSTLSEKQDAFKIALRAKNAERFADRYGLNKLRCIDRSFYDTLDDVIVSTSMEDKIEAFKKSSDGLDVYTAIMQLSDNYGIFRIDSSSKVNTALSYDYTDIITTVVDNKEYFDSIGVRVLAFTSKSKNLQIVTGYEEISDEISTITIAGTKFKLDELNYFLEIDMLTTKVEKAYSDKLSKLFDKKLKEEFESYKYQVISGIDRSKNDVATILSDALDKQEVPSEIENIKLPDKEFIYKPKTVLDMYAVNSLYAKVYTYSSRFGNKILEGYLNITMPIKQYARDKETGVDELKKYTPKISLNTINSEYFVNLTGVYKIEIDPANSLSLKELLRQKSFAAGLHELQEQGE